MEDTSVTYTTFYGIKLSGNNWESREREMTKVREKI